MEEVKVCSADTYTHATKSGLIFELIPKIMADLDPIGKGQKNREQNFMFRGIDDAYNALSQLLAKHKVFTVPHVVNAQRREVVSSRGSKGIHVYIEVMYRFYAGDGSFFESTVQGEAVDYGDKSTSKAMSIAHKYALTQIFMFRTKDQQSDEPDATSPDIGEENRGTQTKTNQRNTSRERGPNSGSRENPRGASQGRNVSSSQRSSATESSRQREAVSGGVRRVNQQQVKSIVDLAAKKGKSQNDVIAFVKEKKGYTNLYQLTEDEGEDLYYYIQGMPDATPPARKLVTQDQITRLWAIAAEKKIPEEIIRNRIWEDYGLESTKDLDQTQYNQLCAEIMK